MLSHPRLVHRVVRNEEKGEKKEEVAGGVLQSSSSPLATYFPCRLKMLWIILCSIFLTRYIIHRPRTMTRTRDPGSTFSMSFNAATAPRRMIRGAMKRIPNLLLRWET